ncbi:hypothetical protein GGX14DRAFT_571015 [Mycena pura]|uniref:Uncharacterized protein n=1 Tax=Mycena pura TaxID=153505 RepID=A0AAD6V4F7_9AGAR|nr:hypothetical protein GGX14DRAFT_571015 [Mycena pura]
MAPTAKPKVVPEGFVLSSDQKTAHCTLCTAISPTGKEIWLAYSSLSNHLKSAGHSRAVEQQKSTRMRAAMIESDCENDLALRREADRQFSALRDIHIPDQTRTFRVQTATETELWNELAENPHAAGFDLGMDTTTQQYNDLCNEMNSLWNAGIIGQNTGFALGEGNDEPDDLFEDDNDDEFLAEIMQNAAINDPKDGDILNFEDQGCQEASAEWAPYSSKMLFLLDTLDNLPRLRISSSLMKVFLWVLKEGGARDVPSFDGLRSVQKGLREKCGVPTTQYTTAMGNIFYMNDPRTIIAKDWANPETRKFIHMYPEIPEDGVIREIWHAQKWRKDMDLDNLSPMYDAKNLQSHFYVNEVARLTSGDFVIPIRWLKYRGGICADALAVSIDSEGVATVHNDQTILITATDLAANYLDLKDDDCIPRWSEKTVKSGHPELMPNPKRVLAGGDPLYSSFIDYFGDDVSGNRSKSWNKHWNAYMTHRNLPRALLQQEFHVHFISTSPNATITEQFTAFKAVVEQTHKEPVKVRDAETGETTRFSIYGNAGPSDNPMQSEISSHIGAKGNYACRKCETGGSEKDKESNECFHSLFAPGVPRSRDKILMELKKQVNLACAGVAKPIETMQRDTGVKDAYTQHWIEHLLEQYKRKKAEKTKSHKDIEAELIQWTLDNEEKIYSGFLTLKGFDPTKDTPVEILHTILLGIVKYIWHSSHTSWSPAQKQLYSLRLQATNSDGLSIHAIRANYIMQYANSLIGRQFKTIAQVNVFHVHGIVTDEQFATWRAVGELATLNWVPEIRNVDEYLGDLRIAAGNVLDAFAVLDPTKILTKIKLHLLTHLGEDVTAFGPLIGVMTEVYECFNAVFRYCSILSNHRAPSRDIALQLADQEGHKHRITGGWWPTPEGDWEQAGPSVRAFLGARPVLQKLVGWTIHNPPTPGSVKPVALPKRKKGEPRPVRSTVTLGSTGAQHALNAGDYNMESTWFPCRQVISAAHDECKIGSWVFVKSPITAKVITGRIHNILEDPKASAIIILDVFQVSEERHEIFGMPTLTRRQSETSLVIVPAVDIKFQYNAQHDCIHARCEATGERARLQERVNSGLVDKFIEHKPIERFILNTHGFHNTHLLRQVLPRHLVAPVPLFTDRKSKHFELAQQLREIKSTKRKRAQEKREARKKTKEAKKSCSAPSADHDASVNGTARNPAAGVDNPPPADRIPALADDDSDPEMEKRRDGAESEDSSDSTDDEAPLRKKQRRRRRQPRVDASDDSGSDSECEQFAPGGYLHDGTSDTQVFGFTESQSCSAAVLPPRLGSPEITSEPESPELRGWSQGDPANPYDPASDLYHQSIKRLRSLTPSPHREPVMLPPPSHPSKRPCYSSPKLEEAEVLLPIRYSHRAAPHISPPDTRNRREEYLELLANMLFGQSYANGGDPHDFPLLLRFGGSMIRNTIISPESIRPTVDEEKAFVARFVEACWQSDPPDTDITHIRRCNDPNALQREYLALFVELTNHIPRLVQTMMDPDRRDDLSATTESMGRIIDGIRLLVGVQKRAQDELASL